MNFRNITLLLLSICVSSAMAMQITPPVSPKKDKSRVCTLKELIIRQQARNALRKPNPLETIDTLTQTYEQTPIPIPNELRSFSFGIIEKETPDRLRFSRDIKILQQQFHTILQAREPGRSKKPKLENLLMKAKTLQHNYAPYLRQNSKSNKQAAAFVGKIESQTERFTGRSYTRKGKTLYRKKLSYN